MVADFYRQAARARQMVRRAAHRAAPSWQRAREHSGERHQHRVAWAEVPAAGLQRHAVPLEDLRVLLQRDRLLEPERLCDVERPEEPVDQDEVVDVLVDEPVVFDVVEE